MLSLPLLLVCMPVLSVCWLVKRSITGEKIKKGIYGCRKLNRFFFLVAHSTLKNKKRERVREMWKERGASAGTGVEGAFPVAEC